MKLHFLPLASAALLAACAAPDMALPGNLAVGGERISFEQMSGWNNGHFVAGDYSGTYSRTLDRGNLGIVKLTEGRGAFSLAGPGISDTIDGECRVREAALAFDGVEISPGKMAYRCDFDAAGQAIPARFEVQESRSGLVANLNQNSRVGEIALAGEVLRFHSVHQFTTATLPTTDPLGYVFEKNGQPVGALQLNGKPVLTLPVNTGLDLRRAMMVASVALATFWDPAAVDS